MSVALIASLAATLALTGTPSDPPPAAPPAASTLPPEAATSLVVSTTSPTLIDPSGQWRAARWGMTVDQVLKAFPGEAKRVEPVLKLANGTTVEVRIDGQTLLGHPLRAAFVFEGGKLALVSLRTPEKHFAPASAYDEAVKFITERLGKPKEKDADANFIDMRQATWKLPEGLLDLKFIPGVLVLLYHPT